MGTYTLRFFILGFGTILFFSSCEVINPSEEIPSYLRIDSISFIDSTNNNLPVKLNSQKIVDAWVFIDGQLQGTYELPTTFPVLMEGTHKISIYPGVLIDGIAATRSIYSFFHVYEKNITFQKEKVDTIRPVSSYYTSRVNYPSEGGFPEDFEAPGNAFRTGTNSKVDTIIKTSEDSLVFDGNFSGMFLLDTSKNYLLLETIKKYTLPGRGVAVYLELNFRTNTELRVGMYAESNLNPQITDVPLINLNPTNNEWKKVYINLTDEVSSITNSRFKIYFQATHNTLLNESKIVLDNIRLIHR